jgi:uncharacterized protein
VAPNSAAAAGITQRLGLLPQVSQTITLDSLVPSNQDTKVELIQKAATAIGSSLNPAAIEPRPTDAENVKALTSTAATLSTVAEKSQGLGVGAAKRLSGLLLQLATSEPRLRRNFETALVEPLRIALEELRQALQAQRITTENIPADLARLWVSPDGRARVQVLAYGDPDDTAVIRNFVTTVLAVEPNATGPAVMLFEAGNTIVRSFIEAAIFAVLAIATLLWIALRRVADVLLTLVPLLVAAVVTLELCAAFDLPLNFANIIALPVLLGVGVAFKIYYIMAWRSGQTALVQSPLTRAVMFSAMTTATGFGSLWLSNDPGTSSMGRLMALALVCTMTAAVFFQPALMGPPPSQVSRWEPEFEPPPQDLLPSRRHEAETVDR